MQFPTLSSMLLLAASATAQVMSIQTNTDVGLTTTTEAQMSIPQGETPITTPLTNPLTPPTTLAPTIQTSIPGVTPVPLPSPVPMPSSNDTTTSTGPTNTTTLSVSPGPSQQPTAGAVPVLLKGSTQAWLYAVVVSGLSVTFGFAWSLL